MDLILQRCKLSYGKMKGPVLGSIARMRIKVAGSPHLPGYCYMEAPSPASVWGHPL